CYFEAGGRMISINDAILLTYPNQLLGGSTITYNAGFTRRSVTAGISAINPGVQGDCPLTSEINEISVCGTTNDAVTLDTAEPGKEITIINNGAQTLEIFPASGDDLGAGVNTATTLIAGANITFVSYNYVNWEIK
ncbi:MAG: hypothetical protein KKH44_02995, partial [Bacteroidetes bacterium]|nr:hypothetical protein [Bacteroidota bacterium]